MFETILGILAGGSLLALGGIAVTVSIACACIWYIFLAVGYWKIFGKAGETSWKALIPILNTYTRYKISWSPSIFWLSIVLSAVNGTIPEDAGFIIAAAGVFVSIAGLVISAKSCGKLADAFGYGTGFAAGLFFLEPIFVLILGCDSSEYLGPSDT